MEKVKIITPNQLEEAKGELNEYDLGGYKLPTEIKEAEKNDYVLVCIRSSDSKNNMSKVHNAITRYITQTHWNKMQRDLNKKDPTFSMVLNDLFNLVVVMHNPTLKEKKKEKVIEITEEQKVAIGKLLEEGKSIRPIAQELGIKEKHLKPYLATL